MSDGPFSAELEKQLFEQSPGALDGARATLLRYNGREIDRVRRAVVMLADGQLELLAHYTDRAIQDYRDVLYWAECPDESGRGDVA